MPAYEFRCRECGATYEVTRPMDQSGDPAACPEGHRDTVRLLTFAAAGGRAASAPAGGGCCGGGCGCR